MGASLPRRRFFLHPAHDAIGLSAAAGFSKCACEPADDARVLRVCLAPRAGEEAIDTLMGCAAFAALRSVDDPEDCDCLVLLSPCAANAISPSAGLVALGSQWHDWPAFARDVLGAEFLPPAASCRSSPRIEVKPIPTAWSHPILNGIEAFTARGVLHRVGHLAGDARILLLGSVGPYCEPLVWTRIAGWRWIVYIGLDFAANFPAPPLVRLLANAIRWAGGGLPPP
ncbi:MAG: hypothetical protein ABSG68_20800 [Thermoguttaceae bacterium]|jgi:hypothetical protein